MSKLTRTELYDRVWQTPMRTLAKEFEISDVGLKKICARHDVPTPGVGYWGESRTRQEGDANEASAKGWR